MKAKAGDVIEFQGCAWEDGWEFDAPCVVYSPLKRYGCGGSIPWSVYQLIEDVCIDLVCGEDVREGWHASDLKEFDWRGWDKDGFANRKSACHLRVTMEFFEVESMDDKTTELYFRCVKAEEREGTEGEWKPNDDYADDSEREAV